MLRLRLTPGQRSDVQDLRRDENLKLAGPDRVEKLLLLDMGWRLPQIAERLGHYTVSRSLAIS